jgi:hypothetical protein
MPTRVTLASLSQDAQARARRVSITWNDCWKSSAWGQNKRSRQHCWVEVLFHKRGGEC